jgi:hypothetical protein
MIADFVRKVVNVDHILGRQSTRLLNGVLQFAHVARPRAPQDSLEGGLCVSGYRSPQLSRDFLEQRVGEGPDVLRALSKGRNDNLDDAQPVEQVAAEPTFCDLLDEIAIGRGDHANVYGPQPVRADAPDLSLLENAQQLHLHRQRDFAYFVEQEGSAVRFFEKPRMVLQGTRECTSCVPEQLALEKTFDNGAAVHGNESAGSSRRGLVNELGEALCADPLSPTMRTVESNLAT